MCPGCGSPVVKVSDHGRHVMSSSPEPLKTRRVRARCTLNLSRAQTSSRSLDNGEVDIQVGTSLSKPLHHANARADERLNHGQVTRTTPELTSIPHLISTPHQRKDV
ncbi:hypothetical protein TNCV_299661 [Trichonephila clavipes]|nr:hypothetical protein TNCV_299661 [Trichonephila clavipes]